MKVRSLAVLTSNGSVTVEFILLFPFIMAMLYASAVYGIIFFAKYQMQDAVDRAVAAALHVDRSAYAADEITAAVKSRAGDALAGLKEDLPGPLVGDCTTKPIGGIEMVVCSLTYPSFSSNPIVPSLNFGWLGKFPPLPESLDVSARAAF
ncbi:TadE/TadG family type IV pilus assembly protein [Alloalcanivorax xenomutans]|jgi:TadE-like protein|uniref:TadE/TadG family type IV pilus assembly protein n=1 Tax=Alloalcanivorax xenomutans TaxID=1094342 RepID=UPI00185AF98A|nr:TadE family protein [Alloalcanivorax xenomutans]MBA4719500.1 pilus assembly protein [Alcanivorax sp.]MCE7523028.1 pilus assembly protein [Alloalcanivorax xenomutans]